MDVKQIILRDFTGGLNLVDDEVNLQLNEVPDCYDVDFLPQGGFRQRRGHGVLYTDTWGTASALDLFVNDATGQEFVLLFHTEGANAVVLSINNVGTATTVVTTASWSYGKGAQFKSKYYIKNQSAGWRAWDGTTLAAAMATSYSDNLATPGAASMPPATLAASHQGYFWVADVLELATTWQHSRVRFSHPNNAEAWRTNDYIDVNPGDGETVQAIIPMGDRLLVFKQHSMWAIFGYSADTFQLVNISKTVGVVGGAAACEADGRVAFCSSQGDVYMYDGDKLDLISQKLGRPALANGTWGATVSGYVGWGGQERKRLYVSTSAIGETTGPRGYGTTYVWDPLTHAWTRYARQYSNVLTSRFTLNVYALSNGPSGRDVVKIDNVSGNTVYDNVNGATVAIPAYVRTAWLVGNTPAVKKRWRRAEFLMNVENRNENATARLINGTVYKDWENGTSASTFTVDPGAPSTGTSAGRDQYVRGSSLGSARGVSLKLTRSSTVIGTYLWGVDQLVVKYVPRALR
jgi:hypothetical protein